jgi:hypothetical protein
MLVPGGINGDIQHPGDIMKYIVFLWGVLVAVHAFAWGPATHVYLAERATGLNRPDVHFGSMLTDMNQMVFNNPELMAGVRYLTHWEPERVAPSALALGMLTHNEAWGADWYSHQYWLPETPESAELYSTGKIRHLEEALDVKAGQAEFLFEFAIEYLLRVDEGTALGRKMLAGAAEFGPAKQRMIVEAFAAPLANRVAGLSEQEAEKELRTASRLFRFVTEGYGASFVCDEAAFFRALRSFTAFYLHLEPETAGEYLSYAIELCRDDYRAELDRITEELSVNMAKYAPGMIEACAWGCCAPAGGSAEATLDPVMGLLLALGAFRVTSRRVRNRAHKARGGGDAGSNGI